MRSYYDKIYLAHYLALGSPVHGAGNSAPDFRCTNGARSLRNRFGRSCAAGACRKKNRCKILFHSARGRGRISSKGWIRPLHNVTIKMGGAGDYFYTDQHSFHRTRTFMLRSMPDAIKPVTFPKRSGGETPPPYTNFAMHDAAALISQKNITAALIGSWRFSRTLGDANDLVSNQPRTTTWFIRARRLGCGRDVRNVARRRNDKFLFYRGWEIVLCQEIHVADGWHNALETLGLRRVQPCSYSITRNTVTKGTSLCCSIR